MLARQQRYREMFEGNGAVQLAIDVQTGAIVGANEAAAAFYAYTRETMLHMNLSELTTMPADELLRDLQAVGEGERGDSVRQHRRASGETRDVEIHTSLSKSGGRPLIYAIVHDITERKQAEAAVRASDERNRLALQAAGMGTWDWDVIRDVQSWSPETEALNGLAPGTFEGTFAAFLRSIHPDDWSAVELESHAMIAERRDSVVAYRTVWPDDRCTGSKAEAAANQALVQDPLNLAEVQDLLTTTTQAALDGGETVKRLLLFTRAVPEQDGKRVDLGTVVRDAAQLTAPCWRDAAQAEGRPISLYVEAESHPTIQGFPARLRELMTNLIFNAVDALPTGGTIRLRVVADDGQGVIEVADTAASLAGSGCRR